MCTTKQGFFKFYFGEKLLNKTRVGTVMIYKVLDKEEIGRLKEELSLGLPGTAKVYIVMARVLTSWYPFCPFTASE